MCPPLPACRAQDIAQFLVLHQPEFGDAKRSLAFTDNDPNQLMLDAIYNRARQRRRSVRTAGGGRMSKVPPDCVGRKGKLFLADGVPRVYWYLDKRYLAPKAAAADPAAAAASDLKIAV